MRNHSGSWAVLVEAHMMAGAEEEPQESHINFAAANEGMVDEFC